MARFTELPFGNEGLVLPSQQQTQQGLSALSNNLLQMRQYMEGEKDKRDQAYVDATTFAIDPSITENAQRQGMADDATEYQKNVKELYNTPDSGYMKLNNDELLKRQNLRNELVSKQAQRIAAQNAYAAQYKEFTDPKNRGLYKPDYFEAQAKRFQDGEIITDFLDTYPIDSQKLIGDTYKERFSINMEGTPAIKNLKPGFYSSTTSSWSGTLLGDKEPTLAEVKKTIGDQLYNDATNPESYLNHVISQDIAQYDQKNPGSLQEFGQDPEKFKDWLVTKYGGSVIPNVYKQKTSEAKHEGKGTTVNNYSGDAKPKTIYYNKTQDGYLFGGKHGAPIQFSLPVVPDYYTMDGSGNLVKATSTTPSVAETFKDAQINSIVKRGGKVYAGISKNKLIDQPDVDRNGTPIIKKAESKDLSETIYVPYDQVSSLVKQEGYNLEPIAGFFDAPSIVR